MSHRAISTALIAEFRIGPPRQRGYAKHGLPEELDIGGVLADEEALVLHDGLRDGGFLAGDGAFAEADQAAVGVDLAEDPVQAAGVHHERLQPGDLQVQGFGSRGHVLRGRPDRTCGRAHRGLNESPAIHAEFLLPDCTAQRGWYDLNHANSSGHRLFCGQPAARSTGLVDHRAHPLGADQPAGNGRRHGYPPPGRATRRHARQRGPHGHGRHQRVLPDARRVPLSESLPAGGPRHVRRRRQGGARSRHPRGGPLRSEQDAESRLRCPSGVVLPQGRRQPGHLQRPLFHLHQRRILSRPGDEDSGRRTGAIRRGRPVLQHVRQPVHRLQRRIRRPLPLRCLPRTVSQAVRAARSRNAPTTITASSCWPAHARSPRPSAS